MTIENAVRLMGLTLSYTEEDVNRVYKQLAKKHHPDVGGLESNFKLLNQAKEILLNHLKNKHKYNVNGRTYSFTDLEEKLAQYMKEYEETELKYKTWKEENERKMKRFAFWGSILIGASSGLLFNSLIVSLIVTFVFVIIFNAILRGLK